MHQIDMPMAYHVWGAMLELYQRYTPMLIMLPSRKTDSVADIK